MQMRADNSIPANDQTDHPFWREFSPCSRTLYAFLKKALNYSEDAADIYQDTVLRACRYFPTYNPQSSFRSWLYAIAHNELRKHYRRRSEESRQLPEEFLATLPVMASDLIGCEDLRRLHALAMELKPSWREVFFLYYQDGFSVEEVAKITTRSGGHVKFILNRCRKAVRARLGGLT